MARFPDVPEYECALGRTLHDLSFLLCSRTDFRRVRAPRPGHPPPVRPALEAEPLDLPPTTNTSVTASGSSPKPRFNWGNTPRQPKPRSRCPASARGAGATPPRRRAADEVRRSRLGRPPLGRRQRCEPRKEVRLSGREDPAERRRNKGCSRTSGDSTWRTSTISASATTSRHSERRWRPARRSASGESIALSGGGGLA